MIYDIEADFWLLTTCNFRCSYCFVPVSALSAPLKTVASNAQWQDAFDATRKRWLIHLTGGEPFIYPDFVDLCERLTRRHFLSINSNLAHKSVDQFAETIDPARVHFINAALHYHEREKKNAVESFIERALKLRGAGFSVFVSLVMTAAVIEEFESISRRMEQAGLPLVPKTLRGPFEGVQYPSEYTAAQKAKLREYLAAARKNYSAITEAMTETPTLDMLHDDGNIDGIPNYRGRMCGSGYNFVRIATDGTLRRCGTGEPLGNLLTGDLRLYASPKECDTQYCPYWCKKYTSAKFVGNSWARGVGLTVLGGYTGQFNI